MDQYGQFPEEDLFVDERGKPKPLKELLERYTFHAGPQQDNLDTLIQSDEMARRLRNLDEFVMRCASSPLWRQHVRRILDGETE